MKNIKTYTWAILGFFLLFLSSPIFAESNSGGSTAEGIVEVIVAITILFVAFILWLALVYSEKNDFEGQTFMQPFKNFMQAINKTTPIEEESKILLDHDYDGIKELNNKIPPWYNVVFIGTIIFAIIYMVNYHVIGSGNVQEDEYAEEVRLAAIQQKLLNESGKLIDESTVKFVDDPGSLANGKEIFIKHCAACHGQKGEGLVGPNFTDDYWIHGNTAKDLFKTIKYGVAAKGMPTWSSQLSPNDMQDVESYIITLRGTNPPNQKAPQGKLYKYDDNAQKGTEAKGKGKSI